MSLRAFLDFPLQTVFASVLIILVYLLKKILSKRNSNFPPGPKGFPIVGYLPFLTQDIHLDFTELSKRYGPIYSIKLGSRTAVVLCKTSAIKEAMVKKEFLGRPPNMCFDVYGHKSLFFSNEMDSWKEHKQFVVRLLSDIKPEMSKMEICLRDEVGHFVKHMKSFSNKPLYLSGYLRPSVTNNICSFMFGESYEYNDPELIFLDSILAKGEKAVQQTTISVFLPWIVHIPFIERWLNYKKILQIFMDIEKFFSGKIDIHKRTLDTDYIRDFVDEYLLKIRSNEEKHRATKFSELMLRSCTMDMYGAGTLTVINTIRWCVYIMAAYPEIQRKVQSEIDDVIGSERLPEFSDRRNMPYTHAIILETMRWKPVVPVGIIKYTTSDATVSSYKIPKGTLIFTNIWAVHHDPDNWDDPEKFRPERFLDADGRLGAISDHFMPFMVGYRSCAGEIFANVQMFLYFTSLLQSFDVAFPSGFQPTFEGVHNLDYEPVPFEICLLPRDEQLNSNLFSQ